MKRKLKPTEGKGKEISDFLRRELQISDGAKWFEVRVAVNELITVRTEYFPFDKDED